MGIMDVAIQAPWISIIINKRKEVNSCVCPLVRDQGESAMSSFVFNNEKKLCNDVKAKLMDSLTFLKS